MLRWKARCISGEIYPMLRLMSQMLSPLPLLCPKRTMSLAYDCGLSAQTMLRSVDLPAPFSPERAQQSPLRMESERSFSMVRLPYLMFTLLKRMTSGLSSETGEGVSGSERISSATASSRTCEGTGAAEARYSCRVTFSPAVMFSTFTTWVMNSGMSSLFDCTRMTLTCVSDVRTWRNSCSCRRALTSSPMKGLSMMRTRGLVSSVFVSWNLRSSPLDSMTMCLSKSVSRRKMS